MFFPFALGRDFCARANVNDRFLRQSGGRVRMPTVFPDIKKFIDAFHNRRAEFTRQDNASDLLLARSKKGFEENIYATYLMGTAHFGKLTTIAGARLEQTDFKGWAHQVSTPGGILRSITRVEANTDSTDVLPSVNLIYWATPQLQFRAAATKTIARPNPQDVLPVRTINDTNFTITDGNPDLEVSGRSIESDFGPLLRLGGKLPRGSQPLRTGLVEVERLDPKPLG